MTPEEKIGQMMQLDGQMDLSVLVKENLVGSLKQLQAQIEAGDSEGGKVEGDFDR